MVYSNSLVLDSVFHCGLVSKEGPTSPIVLAISKILVGKGTKSSLHAADFHGHELKVLVKMWQVNSFLRFHSKIDSFC